MQISSVPRDLRALAKQAIAEGWQISVTGHTHLRWQAPSGALVFCAGTPSDRRALANIKSRLRRAGLCQK